MVSAGFAQGCEGGLPPFLSGGWGPPNKIFLILNLTPRLIDGSVVIQSPMTDGMHAWNTDGVTHGATQLCDTRRHSDTRRDTQRDTRRVTWRHTPPHFKALRFKFAFCPLPLGRSGRSNQAVLCWGESGVHGHSGRCPAPGWRARGQKGVANPHVPTKSSVTGDPFVEQTIRQYCTVKALSPLPGYGATDPHMRVKMHRGS